METNKDNKKIEELTDEQLKKVAGGAVKLKCESDPLCVKSGDDSKCIKCREGFVLNENNRCVRQ